MSFTSSDIVLVTGANGHVAQHVVQQLLSDPAGPRVRATVRSASSAAPLEATFADAISTGRLAIVLVPDLTRRGAFVDVLRDVTLVAHVASPLNLAPQDVARDVLDPAVRGTVGLLEDARSSTSLRAVVVTSSFAAVFDSTQGLREGYVYTKQDWSPLTYADGIAGASVEGRAAWAEPRYANFVSYMASKTLAEKGAWEWYAREKGEGRVAWSLTTLCPTYIGGPSVLPLKGDKGVDGLSLSQNLIWKVASGEKLEDDFPYWVDVRDVARAHVQALLREQAWGSRWILAVEKVRYQDIAAIVSKDLPEFEHVNTETSPLGVYGVETDSSLKALGMESWISPRKMVVDTLKPILEFQRGAVTG